jgi:hypothetical protein
MGAVLVIAVASGFQLEGAVLDLEVSVEAIAERVKHPRASAIRKDVVRNDDMGGEDRDAARDGPDVKIVNGQYARGLADVRANLGKIDVFRRRFDYQAPIIR